MVVDDERDISDVITRALHRTSDFKVDAFYDGPSAFDNFKNHDAGYYSLMLSNIRMPKISGFELAKKIREIDPNMKVVFMTAYDTLSVEPTNQMQSSIEVFVILKKPIKVTEVAPKLINCIVSK